MQQLWVFLLIISCKDFFCLFGACKFDVRPCILNSIHICQSPSFLAHRSQSYPHYFDPYVYFCCYLQSRKYLLCVCRLLLLYLRKHPVCIIYSYVFYAETIVTFLRVANFLVSSPKEHQLVIVLCSIGDRKSWIFSAVTNLYNVSFCHIEEGKLHQTQVVRN